MSELWWGEDGSIEKLGRWRTKVENAPLCHCTPTALLQLDNLGLPSYLEWTRAPRCTTQNPWRGVVNLSDPTPSPPSRLHVQLPALFSVPCQRLPDKSRFVADANCCNSSLPRARPSADVVLLPRRDEGASDLLQCSRSINKVRSDTSATDGYFQTLSQECPTSSVVQSEANPNDPWSTWA